MDSLTESIMEKLAPHHPKKIYLQVPEGLKTRVLDMAAALEAEGMAIVVGCDPTYGACDLRDKEAKALGCDLLLHVGHSDFGVRPVLPVVYEPYQLDVDPVPLLERYGDRLEPYGTLSILTTIQFESLLGPAAAFLEKKGKRILFARQARNRKEGLLLGCDWTAALPLKDRVDAFLYIGSGKFHPLGLARMTDRPVLWLDIETGELLDMRTEKERLERIKAFHLAQAHDAVSFGILVTVKEGQFFLTKAEELKRILQEKGKRAWILAADEVTPAKLAGMKLDVLVNCACPRMDEDFSLFRKPVLNPDDVYKL